MVRKTEYATEEDILKADFKPSSKLNFGGNLYLSINKDGQKYFQFRRSIGGSSSMLRIGKYPDVSLIKAREIAADRQAKVVKFREEKREDNFNTELSKLKQGRGIIDTSVASQTGKRYVGTSSNSSFKYIEDGGRFIRNLFSMQIPNNIRWAIWLQMLIPWRSNEIFLSKWEDFDSVEKNWKLYKKRWSGGQPVAFEMEYISPAVHDSLNEYFNSTPRASAFYYEQSGNNLGFVGNVGDLFPELINLSKPLQNKGLRVVMDEVWPDYSVDAKYFIAFFVEWANKFSFFSAGLIDAIVSCDDAKYANHDSYHYNKQKKALLDWWGIELLKMKNNFINPYEKIAKRY